MDFSKVVKDVMDKSGLKKSDVARETGYSYQHIHDLLAGERRWNEDSINRVFKALGIEVNFNVEEKKESDPHTIQY